MGLFSKLFGGDETEVAVAGQQAQATIVSLRESGPYINDRPTITLELDIGQ